MTPDTLRLIMPHAGARSETFAPYLTEAMTAYAITTPQRQAAFLAQLAHESGSLQYVRELADGRAYEGRADLGNTQPGDGQRYKGRGLIQITGRRNYAACGKALGVSCLAEPDLLAVPRWAALSAGWFWASRNLNDFADADKFGALTRAINGGFNGLDGRIGHWLRARKVLGL